MSIILVFIRVCSTFIYAARPPARPLRYQLQQRSPRLHASLLHVVALGPGWVAFASFLRLAWFVLTVSLLLQTSHPIASLMSDGLGLISCCDDYIRTQLSPFILSAGEVGRTMVEAAGLFPCRGERRRLLRLYRRRVGHPPLAGFTTERNPSTHLRRMPTRARPPPRAASGGGRGDCRETVRFRTLTVP